MGLTKEVRDFFTGRINRLLNAKLKAINEQIDQKQVNKQALEIVLHQSGVPTAVFSRYVKIQEEQGALRQEGQEIRSLIYSKAQKAFPKDGIQSYHEDVIKEIGDFAVRKFGEKIIADQYPQLVEEISKIKRIKEDVESVVLLSTTEAKLVERLTTVLKKYGGDILELKDYIPE